VSDPNHEPWGVVGDWQASLQRCKFSRCAVFVCATDKQHIAAAQSLRARINVENAVRHDGNSGQRAQRAPLQDHRGLGPPIVNGTVGLGATSPSSRNLSCITRVT